MSLTAAAKALELGRTRLTPSYDSWQREVWGYYDELGEFRYGVDWLANMVSRVRLKAAKIVPGQDEPEIVSDGLAAELVADLVKPSLIGGEPQLMGDFATQLSVPGECWLVGEETAGVTDWTIRSTDEIRGHRGQFEVVDLEVSTNTQIAWRDLSANAQVVRVWGPHARYHHRADSPARTARGTMRELELVNRHIVAQYLSRLASAGVFIMPEEVTFPVREEFQDADDPFVREWIETAKEAIQTPGTAAAVVPIPMRVPAEYVDRFKFEDFTLKIDEKILEKRESAIKRLAIQMDLPAEVLLGMGDVNHWTAWQLEESGIKTHISPVVERVVWSLTPGYLRPRMLAAGEAPDEVATWMMWYDASEITQRPDRSENAFQAYDRIELSGEALRRESGFDESDKPTDGELRDQLLKRIAADPALAPTVIEELTGEGIDVVTPAPATNPVPAPAGVGSDSPDAPDNSRGTPDGQGTPPPPPDRQGTPRAAGGLTEELRSLVRRAEAAQDRLAEKRPHWLERRIGAPVRIVHPPTCALLPVTCRYDEALASLHVIPGRTGQYECWLDAGGTILRVGRLRSVVTEPVVVVDALPELATTNGRNGAHPGT